jgi:hypothetical protein
VSKNKSKIELALECNKKDITIAKSKTISTEYFIDKTVAHPYRKQQITKIAIIIFKSSEINIHKHPSDYHKVI